MWGCHVLDITFLRRAKSFKNTKSKTKAKKIKKINIHESYLNIKSNASYFPSKINGRCKYINLEPKIQLNRQKLQKKSQKKSTTKRRSKNILRILRIHRYKMAIRQKKPKLNSKQNKQQLKKISIPFYWMIFINMSTLNTFMII